MQIKLRIPLGVHITSAALTRSSNHIAVNECPTGSLDLRNNECSVWLPTQQKCIELQEIPSAQ